ncbi:MAG: MGDG synthase family glycosyltransferase [Eubacteriaceae bacterium]
MDKVLIFSASTGGGHNIAANSIKEHFNSASYEAVIYDAFKDTNILLDRVIAKGYERMVSIIPRTYGRLYKAANNETLSHYIIAIITDVIEKNLLEIIHKEKPDLIVVTHPLVTNVLGTLRGEGEFVIPIISIVTDYMIHRAYINPQISAYIVGSDYTKKNMIEKGVEDHKIYPYGIPVRKSFIDYHGSENRDYDVDLSILLMAGSMGTSQLEKALLNLIDSVYDLKLIVVCGNNCKMKRKLEKIIAEKNTTKKIEVYGFVENIPELMDKADVIITKPGGLTTTESIIKNIPMVIPYYIPGQEEENTDFLVETGMAIKVDKINELSNVVDYLVRNKDILDNMAKNMSEVAKEQSIERIINLGSKLMKLNIKNSL